MTYITLVSNVDDPIHNATNRPGHFSTRLDYPLTWEKHSEIAVYQLLYPKAYQVQSMDVKGDPRLFLATNLFPIGGRASQVTGDPDSPLHKLDLPVCLAFVPEKPVKNQEPGVYQAVTTSYLPYFPLQDQELNSLRDIEVRLVDSQGETVEFEVLGGSDNLLVTFHIRRR